MGEENFPGRQEEEEEFFLGELTRLSAAQGSTGDSLKGLLAEFKLDTCADVTVILPACITVYNQLDHLAGPPGYSWVHVNRHLAV